MSIDPTVNAKKTVNLVFGVHCHQPVGNFDFVFEQVYQNSYLPFLEVLSRHPGVKLTLHYTGGLLEWIENHHPEWFRLLQTLVDKKQVELLGGGFYEPILAVIPEADRRGQVQLLSSYLQEKFKQKPRGMWLAERIWDSAIVPAVSGSGIEYALVDDYHFICAGLETQDLYGYYYTEEEGHALGVFPIDSKMRYLTPFQSVSLTLDYLAQVADESGERCVIVMDDGEKYGSWPDTYHWVYAEGWLEQFFTALETQQDWIKTQTFSQVFDQIKPQGRTYLPTASYYEMGQWSLPAPKAQAFGTMQHYLKDLNKLEEFKPFMRGGIWKNFLVKYPESNLMHKKMLCLSERIKEMPESEERDAAQNLIYKAQTNDAYWHGVFGGLYLPHLRHEIYRFLIKAERCLDTARLREERGSGVRSSGLIRKEEFDFDKDGYAEILLSTPFFTCGIQPHLGGQIFEYSVKPLGYNLLNTLQRRFEHYHKLDAGDTIVPPESEGIHTIHDREHEINQQLRNELYYDWYLRRAFIDHFLGDQVRLPEFAQSSYVEQGDFVNQTYTPKESNTHSVTLIRSGGVWENGIQRNVTVEKTFTVEDKELWVQYCLSNKAAEPLSLRFGVECNLAMPASGGSQGYYRLIQSTLDTQEAFDYQGEDFGVENIALIDEILKGTVTLAWDKPATLWRFPIETVSQSEAGWERTYQSSVIFPNWHISLEPEEKWQVQIRLGVEW